MTATVPPGSATLASFTTEYGMPGLVVKAPQADGYGLVFPGSTVNPLRIRELDPMSNVRLAGQLAVRGDNVLLFEGSDQSCPQRAALVSVRYPQVRSITLPVCGQSFGMSVRPDGHSVLLRSTAARPATLFVYDDGRFTGPSVERAVQRASAPRRVAAHTGPGRPPSATAPAAPTDIDSLPPVGNSVPLNLDQ